jgi:AraC-like DNA-binding protein
MQPIPLIHRSALVPLVTLLDEVGAPTAKLMARERLLPTHYEGGTTGYVPILSTWAFADHAADAEGIWDLGFRIAERVTLAHASRWGPRVSTAVTLWHAIKVMAYWIRHDLPDVRVGVEERWSCSWFWRDHQPDRRHCRGYWIGEQYILGLMVELVRLAEGPNWMPRQLQVQARANDWAFKRPEFAGDAQIEYGAARTAILLPPGSLRRRLTRTRADLNGDISGDMGERPATDLEGSLHQVLKSITREQKLTVELATHGFGISERSLRRGLAQHGLGWREVVSRVQLETALDLMDDPTCSLEDIANILGYTQYPHFYRAFRRWTRESPRKYREKLAP